jgi:sec-independent protein translocase protein TatB
MFDIGWGELLLIGIVALIAIGPKELPTVLRTLGQWMAKLRRMATEFQNQFHEAMREAEMSDLKKTVDDLTTTAHSYANFDPVSEVRKELDSTQQQIESALAKPADASSLPAGAETASPVPPSPELPSPQVQSPQVQSPQVQSPEVQPPQVQSPDAHALPAPASAEPAMAPSAGGDVVVPAPAEPATVGAGTDSRSDAGGKPA